MWFSAANPSIETPQLLLSIADSNGDTGISIYLEKGNLYTTHWYYNSNDDTYKLQPGALAISDSVKANSWHHIALTFDSNNDGSEKADGLVVYLDGKEQGSISTVELDSNQLVSVGGIPASREVKSHQFNADTQQFEILNQDNGSEAIFDEIRIYDRTLTSSDVLGLYDDSTTGALSAPTAFTLSTQGEVYVTDSGDGKVKVFNNDGSFLKEISLAAATPYDKFLSIALDSNGNMYVADLKSDVSDDGKVQVFDGDGIALDSITAYSGAGFEQIHSVHVDTAQRLYIGQYDTSGSHTNSMVHVFDLVSGTPVERVQITEAKSGSALKKPSAITTDRFGNLFVTDSVNQRIVMYDKSLNYQAEWGGANNFMFDEVGTIVDFGSVTVSLDGDVFFGNGDAVNGTLSLYQTRMPEKVITAGGSLSSIVGNTDGELFISRNNEVTKYTPKDRSFATICTQGTGSGQVTNPGQLAIDGFDRIYVADTGAGNGRVQVVDSEGVLIRDLAEYATAALNMQGAKAVAVSPYLEVVVNGEDDTTPSPLKKLLQFDLNDGLATLLSNINYLNLSASEVSDLERKSTNGQDIGADLKELGITLPAFRFIAETLRSTVAIDAETWDNIVNILIQARKTNPTSLWKATEVSEGFYLSPSLFQSHPERQYEEPRTFIPWRSSYLNRLEWEERLHDRFELIKATLEAQRNRVTATDEECLALLKTVLIEKSPTVSTTLDAKTTELSNALLLDLKNECCSQTTRVAIAMETLQSLAWRLRTGQLENHLSTLTIIDDDFDAAWKWRSSYRTWKSAQFVNLFPENLLFPEIKPNQTGPYQKLVESLNSNPYITPEDACSLSNEYAEYLKNISHFDQMIGTYGTYYTGGQDPCGHYNPTGVTDRIDDNGKTTSLNPGLPAMYFFGLNKESGKVYYAIYDYEDDKHKLDDNSVNVDGRSGFQDMTHVISDWKEVPDLENISELAAAISYPKQTRGSSAVPVQSLTLFLSYSENAKSKPAFISLDVKENSWGRQRSIKVPGDLSDGDISLLVGDTISSATNISVSAYGGAPQYYSNKFNGNIDELVYKDWNVITAPVILKSRRLTRREVEFTLTNGDKHSVPAEDVPGLLQFVVDKSPLVNSYDKEYDEYYDHQTEIQCVAAAGDAIVFKSSEDAHRYFVSFKDFIYTKNKGDWDERFFELETSYKHPTRSQRYLEKPRLESFFRWQDYVRLYVAIFVDKYERRYYNIIDLDSHWTDSWTLSGTIDHGRWKYGAVHSAVLSPESNGKALFKLGTEDTRFGASVITPGKAGSFSINKIWGRGKNWTSEYTINPSTLDMSITGRRELTPRRKSVKETVSKLDGPIHFK